MANLMDRAAEHQVTEQPMAVGSHGDEITLLAFRGLEDFTRRIAQGQVGRNHQAGGPEVDGGLLEVLAVGFHFFGLGKFELIEIPGHPTVRHVDEEQLGMEQLGELLDVREQAGVRLAVFEGDKDFSIHDASG